MGRFPSGLVGTLTCVLCAYLGVEAGKVLLTFQANTDRILRWTAWSAFTVSFTELNRMLPSLG